MFCLSIIKDNSQNSSPPVSNLRLCTAFVRPSPEMTLKDSMEVTRSDLKHSSCYPEASIDDVQHLASYNWINASTPTLVVPGIPPLWSPPNVSRHLPKDSGLVYINQNAARHPDSPMEPLF